MRVGEQQTGRARERQGGAGCSAASAAGQNDRGTHPGPPAIFEAQVHDRYPRGRAAGEERLPSAPLPVAAWHALWLGAAVLAGCGGSGGSGTLPESAPSATGAALASGPGPVDRMAPPSNGFAPSSPWNRLLPRDVPLAPNSTAIVANLAADRSGGYAVWPLMTDTFSAPIYIATPDTPKQTWSYDNCTQASGLHPPFGEALAGVPTLPEMVVSNGTDGEVAIYDPASDSYWDFWRAKSDDQGRWSACWGGKITSYSQNLGVFEPPLGATATGLALGAFLIRIDELARGHIDHAINIATVRTRKGCHSWPANRDDGNTDGDDIACEGQRFRLDPSFDTRTLKSPAARTIARAMQRYGLILTDKSDALITQAEDPRPHMARNGGENPYDDLLGGVPWYLALNDVPVERLQALPIDYGKSASDDE